MLDIIKKYINKKQPVKLNLGCYNKKMYGFINIDSRPEVNPDLVDDVFKLEQFENNSVDLIYICHCLEHATFEEVREALEQYNFLLKVGGILRIAVPNIKAAAEHLLYHNDLTLLHSAYWGSQRHDYDFHKSGWTFETLKRDLEVAGFEDIQLYDTWETEHSFVDDYSKAYWPHLDFINGKLMSLNVECKK